MKTLLLAMLLGALFPAHPPSCLKLDVVLVGDYSDSVTGNEPFVVASFRAFADQLELGEDQVRLGVVLFGDQAIVTCPLTGEQVLVRTNLTRLVGQSANLGSTDISAGLLTASAMLLTDRPEAKKLIVLVSDGLHNSLGHEPQGVVELLKLQQILVAPVLILDKGGSNNGRYLMEQIATPGLYYEASYEDLIGVLQKMDVCL